MITWLQFEIKPNSNEVKIFDSLYHFMPTEELINILEEAKEGKKVDFKEIRNDPIKIYSTDIFFKKNSEHLFKKDICKKIIIRSRCLELSAGLLIKDVKGIWLRKVDCDYITTVSYYSKDERDMNLLDVSN
jgi:hypothetical protein